MRAESDIASLRPRCAFIAANLSQRHDSAVALQQAASCKQGRCGVK